MNIPVANRPPAGGLLGLAVLLGGVAAGGSAPLPALPTAGLAASAPTPHPGSQPVPPGGGGGFVALSGAVRLASKWTAVSAGRSGSDSLKT